MINLDISKENFNSLSQIGRITLFMSKCIEVIYRQLDKIDKKNILIFRLDDADQNYKYCKNFIHKLGLNLDLNEQEFLKYKKKGLLHIMKIESLSYLIKKKRNKKVCRPISIY